MSRKKLPSREKIQKFIKDPNLTIEDICKKLGVCYPTFRKICDELKLESRRSLKLRARKFIMKDKCECCQHPFEVCICDGIAHG